jgi:radical SAM-linked protein
MSETDLCRYRIAYAKVSLMRYTSHLDTLRAWERTFRRAQIPMAYTKGFNPRPRINLSSALPLGFTSECELIDIWITEEMDVGTITRKIQSNLPPGLEIHGVTPLVYQAPKLHEEIIAAEYHVHLETFPPPDLLCHQVEQLLSAPEIPRIRRGRKYDLRPLIRSLEVHHLENETYLGMCLAAKEGATGRPEEVLDALQLDPMRASIHRKQFIFVNKT